MSQPTLFYKSATRKVTIMAAIAMVGLTALVSAFFIAADTASNTYATQLESEVTATVDGTHYVSLTASDTTFTITPTSTTTPTTDTQTVNVSVETNAVGGATLYLASTTNTNALYKDGNPTNSNLPHIAASSATVESPTTLDNLAPNTWAYSTDNTNYQGIPTNSDTNGPNLIADINGTTTGTTSGGVTSATIPIYYAAKIDTSIPAGSYASSVTYSAVVDGGIVTSAELTSITIDGTANDPAEMWVNKANTILITTNLKTNTYGAPRVYYTATDPSGYQECGNVIVGSNEDGYMTVTCTTTPTTEATNVTLHIVPKGEPTTGSAASNNLTGDPFCTDGTYNQGTSECEAGEWKWGSFTVTLPDITPAPKPLMELTYMQEMTTKGCAASNVGDTKQLIDKRDNKQYWVAKLKDGNCWMTQNLDLDLTSGVELTPEDSDVSEPWDPGATTFTSPPEGTYDDALVQSWNLGDYVISDPDRSGYCSSGSGTNYPNCADRFTPVSGMTPMTEAINEGKTPAENISVQNGQYDAHFLVGNHYSFQAATAGSAPSGEGDAPDSICPAGWRLPDFSPNEYSALLSEYGIGRGPGQNPNGELNTAPLYFVRSGYVSPSGHYLGYAGNNGYYWYSRTGSSSYGPNLYFYSTNVDPTDFNPRYDGYSVRCIAPSA